MAAKRRDYTQFVHQYDAEDGSPRYAVGEFDPERAQFTAPMDTTTRNLTGCYAEFAKHPGRLSNRYTSRRSALRRARYLFYERDAAYIDFLDEIAETEPIGGRA